MAWLFLSLWCASLWLRGFTAVLSCCSKAMNGVLSEFLHHLSPNFVPETILRWVIITSIFRQALLISPLFVAIWEGDKSNKSKSCKQNFLFHLRSLRFLQTGESSKLLRSILLWISTHLGGKIPGVFFCWFMLVTWEVGMTFLDWLFWPTPATIRAMNFWFRGLLNSEAGDLAQNSCHFSGSWCRERISFSTSCGCRCRVAGDPCPPDPPKTRFTQDAQADLQANH